MSNPTDHRLLVLVEHDDPATLRTIASGIADRGHVPVALAAVEELTGGAGQAGRLGLDSETLAAALALRCDAAIVAGKGPRAALVRAAVEELRRPQWRSPTEAPPVAAGRQHRERHSIVERILAVAAVARACD